MDILNILSVYISDHYGWLDSYSLLVVQEYNKFMELVNLSSIRLVGSEDIEKCWQAHVLDTQLYYDYCFNRFGKIIHYKIIHLDYSNRKIQLNYTIKLYIEKYFKLNNEIVWTQTLFPKTIRPDINYEIVLNVYSLTGKLYFIKTHKFNSCENFGYLKEIFSAKYQISLDHIKIYICKKDLSDSIINNVTMFYSFGSQLEIPNQINISGIFNFGIKIFDIILFRE